jgi:hypothetical protein
MNANIEDLIAIQHLYNAAVALHAYARTVGAPTDLRDMYNHRKHKSLPSYAVDLRLECLMFDASRCAHSAVDIIDALKEIAQDLAAYIR